MNCLSSDERADTDKQAAIRTEIEEIHHAWEADLSHDRQSSMDVEPAYEALFHEVYDTEHAPFLSQVPGVISVRRYQREELTMNIGGQRQTIHLENEPKHMAVYEIESPEVLTSAAWNEAVEKGRWPTEVRPHTKNRRRVLMKMHPPQA